MKDNWKIILLKVIGTILVLFFVFLFVISFNKGSNADIDLKEKPYVKISCYNAENDFDVTWKFYSLNNSEYQNAVDFSNNIGYGDLNCTFENYNFKVNETGGIK